MRRPSHSSRPSLWRGHQITRLSTKSNTFSWSTKVIYSVLLMARNFSSLQAWSQIACHRCAHVIAGNYLSPFLGHHDLVWQFHTSIISLLKGDAFSSVEGDDDALLPLSRDIPEVDDILDEVMDLLHHQRLSPFHLRSGIYQQSCHTPSAWWLWSPAQVGHGSRAFHRVDFSEGAQVPIELYIWEALIMLFSGCSLSHAVQSQLITSGIAERFLNYDIQVSQSYLVGKAE